MLGLNIRAPDVMVTSGKFHGPNCPGVLLVISNTLGSGVAVWNRVSVRDFDGPKSE